MVRKAIKKGIIFLTLLVVIISALNPIFILKSGHRGILIEGLYNHTGDSYDMAFMGGSHMEACLDPNVLWNSYGITSYNYATGGQSIDVTYYMLKEVLKNHNISIVVVDTYYLARSAEYGDKGYISNALDNMNFSINKLEAIISCTPFKDNISYIFPVLKYHDRWDELTKKDFNYDTTELYYTKGFAAGTEKYGKPDSTIASKTNTATIDLPGKAAKYLNKIIDLCKKNDIKLILLNPPCDYNDEAKSNDWVHQQTELFNKVAEIAKENNIPFINYNDKMDDIGIDFPNDMNNAGHLNIWGAYKVTADFGNYLKQNYNLTDYRNDKSYAQWDIDYARSQAAAK